MRPQVNSIHSALQALRAWGRACAAGNRPLVERCAAAVRSRSSRARTFLSCAANLCQQGCEPGSIAATMPHYVSHQAPTCNNHNAVGQRRGGASCCRTLSCSLAQTPLTYAIPLLHPAAIQQRSEIEALESWRRKLLQDPRAHIPGSRLLTPPDAQRWAARFVSLSG